MLIFISGATGLVGQRLVLDRLERGDKVLVLSRHIERANGMFATAVNPNVRVIEGDPSVPGRWQRFVDTCDAVIHLAGENITAERWTPQFKTRIVNSRLDSTHQIVNAIEGAVDRPGVLINASAVGFYGDTGERVVDETASPPPAGRDFLADLCVRWEAQAARAEDHGTRTVMLRIGAILDARGGALPELIRPFRFFVGGKLGSGRQYMPWIHYRDVIGLIDLALRDRNLRGPMNLVSPEPVRNRDFMAELGAALGRPSWFPAPGPGLKAIVGEFANYLLQSQQVIPTKATDFGYHFLFPKLDESLQSLVAALKWRGRRDGGGHSLIFESIDVDLTQQSSMTTAIDGHANGLGPPVTPPLVRTTPRLQRPEAPIKVVAIDVDGTLLRSDGRLAQGVIDACRSATRQGCLVVPATARPPRAMRSILQTLGLEGPTINYNGAVIWDPLDRRALFHESLSPEVTGEIIQRARAILPEVVVSIEVMDRWYTDRVEAGLETETSRIFEPDCVGDIESFLTEPVTKLMLLAPPEQLQPLMDMVTNDYWSKRSVAVFITDPHIIQIANPMVDKGVALQRIAHRAGAEAHEVMAIGDGSNDAGMVEWAGFGVAVENACETLHHLADVVVPSNDDLGVARALQRYVLAVDHPATAAS